MPNYTNKSDEYCIYLRKSRVDVEAEARGDGDTLSRHRRTLLDLARRQELSVTEIYEEVVSGETIDARPNVQRLLADAEAGRWSGVLCMEVERLARGNTRDQGIVAETFQYSGTKIITPTRTYDPNNEADQEYFEFGLFMSRREYMTINRRLQRGRQSSLNEGKYIAGKAVYGYERYKLPKQKGYSLQIIPEQAEVVRQIFEWYVHGQLQPDGTVTQLGAYTIAKMLDARGVLSPGGGKWQPCTVTAIVKNPTYIGKVRWGHRPTVKKMSGGLRTITRPVNDDVPLSDGIHDRILDDIIFYQAQAILKGRSHAPIPKSSIIRNPMAGLIFCSKCGRSLERRKYQHGRDMMMCPNKDCDCKASVLDDVEAALLDGLRLWLAEYKVHLAASAADTSGGPSDVEREVIQLKLSMSTLKKQMDNLYDLVERGIYTSEVFVERSQALTQKMFGVNATLIDAEARLSSTQRLHRNRFEIIPRVENVLDRYPRLDNPREKNDLLKSILEKAVYSKSHGSRWEESDMRLLVFPRFHDDPDTL